MNPIAPMATTPISETFNIIHVSFLLGLVAAFISLLVDARKSLIPIVRFNSFNKHGLLRTVLDKVFYKHLFFHTLEACTLKKFTNFLMMDIMHIF